MRKFILLQLLKIAKSLCKYGFSYDYIESAIEHEKNNGGLRLVERRKALDELAQEAQDMGFYDFSDSKDNFYSPETLNEIQEQVNLINERVCEIDADVDKIKHHFGLGEDTRPNYVKQHEEFLQSANQVKLEIEKQKFLQKDWKGDTEL